MKKLIIVCEGQTEQLFCNKILEDHFKAKDIEIEYPLIAHSNGGIVKWSQLKPQIETYNRVNPNNYITTFIDYYGLESHHDFPKWNECNAEPIKSNRMHILENGMIEDINLATKPKFIPYVQLHEFEALVFSDYPKFEAFYNPTEANFIELKKVCDSNPNPETINNSKLTAPSKRLEDFIPRYNKKSDGIGICEIIGLTELRNKCSRFNQWVTTLENIA